MVKYNDYYTPLEHWPDEASFVECEGCGEIVPTEELEDGLCLYCVKALEEGGDV